MKALSVALIAAAMTGCLTTVSTAQDTTAAATDTSYADYNEPPVTLPLGIGLRPPTYDRVNGLTVPWGPKLEVGDGRVDVDALVSYRSNLGKWDPSLEGTLRPSDQNEITFFAGRGTFSNDTWIRSDLTNSLAAFFVGSDARNYYRSTRGTARYTLTLTGNSVTFTPFVGGNIERDWSTGSLAPTKSPWSFFGRKGNLRMRRPNPPIAKGSITSVLGGTGFEFVTGGVDGKIDADLEQSVRTSLKGTCLFTPGGPVCTQPSDSFTQLTLDGHVSFPTFGAQTLTVRTHAVLTGGAGIAPAQRFAYLGGSGTLATVNLLALGGDHLLFFDGDYMIPFEKIQVPILGNPFLALHYAAGNAGVDKVPALIQNVGVGAGVSMFRVDFTIDPARNRSPFSRRSSVSFGASLSF
ncbi:MAG TPA: hypothetical protein VGG76_03925 [Gemmatimonadaceae bacterium]